MRMLAAVQRLGLGWLVWADLVLGCSDTKTPSPSRPSKPSQEARSCFALEPTTQATTHPLVREDALEGKKTT